MRRIPLGALLFSLAACPSKKPPVDPLESQTPPTSQPAEAAPAPAPDPASAMTQMVAQQAASSQDQEKRAADAVALLTTGNLQDARRAVQLLSALEAELPDVATISYNLGLAHQALDEVSYAEEAFRLATMKDPKLAVAWIRLGQINIDKGRTSNALAFYRQGIVESPENVDLRGAEVAALIRLGLYDDAITAAKAALSVNANSINILVNLSLAYIAQGKLDLASFTLQKAINDIEGADTSADVQTYLARVLQLRGYTYDAELGYKKALELNANHVPAMVFLSELNLNNRDFETVVGRLENARSLAPNDIAVHLNLGIAYRGVGRYDDARKEYQTVQSLDPSRTEPYYNLAILQGDYLKDYSAAMATLQTYRTMQGVDVVAVDQWIADLVREKETIEKLENRKKAAEEARKKREEEQRQVEEAKRIKALEDAAEQERLERERLNPPVENPPSPDGSVPPSPSPEPGTATPPTDGTPWGAEPGAAPAPAPQPTGEGTWGEVPGAAPAAPAATPWETPLPAPPAEETEGGLLQLAPPPPSPATGTDGSNDESTK